MKICIVGISGAGKSTLAKKLSKTFETMAYGYDEIYWDKSQVDYVKRAQGEIDALVDTIQAQDSWIVEGAYDKRLLPFLTDCSLIIRLAIPYHVCAYRIVKRFLRARLVGAKPKETVANTIALLQFAKQFDERLDRFFAMHPTLNAKVQVIDDIGLCVAQIKQHVRQRN